MSVPAHPWILPAGGGGGRRGAPRQRKGKDVLFRLKVTLADLYKGAEKKLRLSKQIVTTQRPTAPSRVCIA